MIEFIEHELASISLRPLSIGRIQLVIASRLHPNSTTVIDLTPDQAEVMQGGLGRCRGAFQA